MASPEEVRRVLDRLALEAIIHRARIAALRYESVQAAIKAAALTGYGPTVSHFPDTFSHYGELIIISRAAYGHNLYLNQN